jgi:hypothetical protein
MSRRGMQVKAMLSMGILVGFGAVSTLAAWTGTATATATINAATVSLEAGSTGSTTTTSYTVPITGTNWYPGMSQAALVVVKNTSPISVPYSITGGVTETGGGTLGNALNVVVTPGGTVSGTSPNATCSGTPLIAKTSLSSFPAAKQGSTLTPGGTETLCVQYSLPINAASGLQGNSTTVKLTFTATVGS